MRNKKIDVERIISARAPEPVGSYPHAVRVGELLFLSGVGPRKRGVAAIPGVALDSKGGIRDYDFEAQCRSTFANVSLILEDAGSSLKNVVDVTAYLTNMKSDFDAYNKIYAEHFPDPACQPARTTLEVNRLPTPIAFELKIIATL